MVSRSAPDTAAKPFAAVDTPSAFPCLLSIVIAGSQLHPLYFRLHFLGSVKGSYHLSICFPASSFAAVVVIVVFFLFSLIFLKNFLLEYSYVSVR